jgi:hypothetical protein
LRLSLCIVYYWGEITKRTWNDDRRKWLYDVLYHDGDTAADLTAKDMFTMEESIETQNNNPESDIAKLPAGWVSPFMSNADKEKMLGMWQFVFAARQQKRGSKAGKSGCAAVAGLRLHVAFCIHVFLTVFYFRFLGV